MGIIRSCYQCTKREIGCHGSCMKYLEEKAIRDSTLNKSREYKKVDETLYNISNGMKKKRKR